ncbi:hypothetical protein PJI17_32260, partial [Mycobacterium kansasii]
YIRKLLFKLEFGNHLVKASNKFFFGFSTIFFLLISLYVMDGPFQRKDYMMGSPHRVEPT